MNTLSADQQLILQKMAANKQAGYEIYPITDVEEGHVRELLLEVHGSGMEGSGMGGNDGSLWDDQIINR